MEVRMVKSGGSLVSWKYPRRTRRMSHSKEENPDRAGGLAKNSKLTGRTCQRKI